MGIASSIESIINVIRDPPIEPQEDQSSSPEQAKPSDSPSEPQSADSETSSRSSPEDSGLKNEAQNSSPLQEPSSVNSASDTQSVNTDTPNHPSGSSLSEDPSNNAESNEVQFIDESSRKYPVEQIVEGMNSSEDEDEDEDEQAKGNEDQNEVDVRKDQSNQNPAIEPPTPLQDSTTNAETVVNQDEKPVADEGKKALEGENSSGDESEGSDEQGGSDSDDSGDEMSAEDQERLRLENEEREREKEKEEKAKKEEEEKTKRDAEIAAIQASRRREATQLPMRVADLPRGRGPISPSARGPASSPIAPVEEEPRGRTRATSFYPGPPLPNVVQKKFVPKNPCKRFRLAVAETIGRRKTMEDVTLVYGAFRGNESEDLFAVFDGHNGKEAADFAADHFVSTLEEMMKEKGDDVEASLRETFLKVNQLMVERSLRAGTTACVSFVVNNILYVANVGDTRALLCRDSKPIRLSVDHKPNLPCEKARIEALGGAVLNNRVNGVLSVSRALGDASLQPFVSSDPHISVTSLSPDTDKFVVMCCDGVFDVFPDEVVVDILNGEPDPEKGVHKLKDRAYIGGSMDNISIIAVHFDFHK